jgi:hypothetical protein
MKDHESSQNMSQKDVFQLEEEIFRLNARVSAEFIDCALKKMKSPFKIQEMENQIKVFRIFKVGAMGSLTNIPIQVKKVSFYFMLNEF